MQDIMNTIYVIWTLIIVSYASSRLNEDGFAGLSASMKILCQHSSENSVQNRFPQRVSFFSAFSKTFRTKPFSNSPRFCACGLSSICPAISPSPAASHFSVGVLNPCFLRLTTAGGSALETSLRMSTFVFKPSTFKREGRVCVRRRKSRSRKGTRGSRPNAIDALFTFIRESSGSSVRKSKSIICERQSPRPTNGAVFESVLLLSLSVGEANCFFSFSDSAAEQDKSNRGLSPEF